MKLFTGWVMSAGLVLTAVAANAQGLAPSRYTVVSDVGGPYSAVPPPVAGPRVVPGPGYGYGPMLLPPQEVYEVVRESGFSPLGIPRQRGFVYTIAVVDRRGNDGRLVIDARDGRIIRFIPAYQMGGNYREEMPPGYGPMGAMPPFGAVGGAPRPPDSVPRMASRTPQVPLPKASPQRPAEVKPLAANPASNPAPEPAQRSAAVQAKPADTQAAAAPAAPSPAIVEAKPAPAIQPTQDMPKAQGLD
jgi:hypothetical protein